MEYIKRKSLLYKTGVEYGDYTINHIQGCAHGCKYPCYAMMMAKRFGRVKTYDDWCTPKIVENAEEILNKELPKLKDKIKSVHLCFTTDPFMYGYEEINNLSIKLINIINNYNLPCTALTKGLLPKELIKTSKINMYGITLISLKETFRKAYEPYSAPYIDRINNLKFLHNNGYKTWVSIEPYPTPNIIKQDFDDILDSISFVDKIIFGKLNYNSLVTKYKNREEYYNNLSQQVINYCNKNNKDYHIKTGTMNINPE